MIKSITSVKVTGRRVILRAGFDVPLEVAGDKVQVADDARIKDILPTLNHLIKGKAKIVIVAHLGRPKGWEKEKSLLPVANRLGELVKSKIIFLADDITKQDFSKMSLDLKEGEILFLENIRFYPEEEANDEDFARSLAAFGEVYVNDAFSVSHRKEVSTFGLAKLLPCYAGLGLTKEISALKKILHNPIHPFVVIFGGAKGTDKIGMLNHLGTSAQHILIGGGVANTFLQALGYEIGKSKASDPSMAKEVLRHFKQKIVLPVDVVVAANPDSVPEVVKIDKVRSDQMILDIGPQSVKKFAAIIKQAQTLVWNGPMGLIEKPKFANGSKALAQIFASRSKGQAYGVIGGGETIEVFDQAQVAEFVDHVSTGGGAMLEFLAGKQLPGIKVLEN